MRKLHNAFLMIKFEFRGYCFGFRISDFGFQMSSVLLNELDVCDWVWFQMSSVLPNEVNVCDWGMVSNEQRAA